MDEVLTARQEIEKAILDQLDIVWKIYKEYHPEGKSLHLGLSDTSSFVFNSHWEEDSSHPVDGFRWRDEIGS